MLVRFLTAAHGCPVQNTGRSLWRANSFRESDAYWAGGAGTAVAIEMSNTDWQLNARKRRGLSVLSLLNREPVLRVKTSKWRGVWR